MSVDIDYKKFKTNADSGLLGKTLQARRKIIGKTMRDVAKDTGLSIGFISQIERNLCAPSLTSVLKLANSLQITVEELLEIPNDYDIVSYKSKRKKFNLGDTIRIYEKLGPGFKGAAFFPCIIKRPFGHFSEEQINISEEFCYILEGKLEYIINGKTHHLEAGDCVHLNKDVPYSSEVISAQAVELWVTSSPLFGINSEKNEPIME